MADGHLGKCKECTKKDVRKRYYDPEQRKKIIEYEIKRNKSLERRKKRIEYQRTSRRRSNHSNARLQVARAIKKGILTRSPCEKCGNPRVEAHHADYSKPLEVQWLCRRHHLIVEGKIPF